jgi:hypothetical protein
MKQFTEQERDLGTLLLNKALLRYTKDKSKCSFDEKNGQCKYKSPNGNMCVFAFITKPSSRHKLKEDNTSSEQDVTKDDIKPMFQKAFEVLGRQSMRNLQILHDSLVNSGGFYKILLNQVPHHEDQLHQSIKDSIKE